ncbi:hypothetical protein EXU48_00150 [Occultella glacieicola]|uniref:Ribbon-helix-helix protein CopG domain-containing protein n=1 Tax=Occultella glacieicola TaxID=2518684 RepID=A0ABY2E828_9MICO|nr:hypothetical protein [Occultella glacieicola]TDE98670.1 hypothetical protein EXU48_00150 [Occultella glacieicola]
MSTTVNVDDHLLAEAKVLAARSHRSIGSVLEDALRAYLDAQKERTDAEPLDLPVFIPAHPGLRPGVDLDDKEQMADLLGDNDPIGHCVLFLDVNVLVDTFRPADRQSGRVPCRACVGAWRTVGDVRSRVRPVQRRHGRRPARVKVGYRLK